MSTLHKDVEDVVEKGKTISATPTLEDQHWSDVSSSTANKAHLPVPSIFHRINARIEGLSGFEARGITRVAPNERHKSSYSNDLQVFLLWLSANVSLNNLGVGMLGPLLFGLGFVDCAICAVVGAFIGSLSTAYVATLGPKSGNRTMVIARFFMGYWPSKIPCVLNIILMIGYATLDAIIGGQVISAVSGGSVSVIVGVVIVSLVSWVVAAFGMALFQRYERYSWLPQFLALFVLIGCAGPYFNAESQSTSTGPALAAARLSFLSICSYIPNSWTAAAADFYVYYPENTRGRKIFALTMAGLWVAFSFVFLVGIGLASGVAGRPEWAAANDISSGALIVAGFEPLKGFGKFCSVIVALGVIANSIPSTYSGALGLQTLGRYGQAVPRWVWSCVLTIIELILGIVGREHLFQIYQNFTSIMGYWIELMVCIFIQEQYLFRRNNPIDWSRWQDKSYLPVGWAALASFLLGWLGAVLGMSQAWYIGPLASLASGADVGMWVGFAFTLVSFPPLRYLELRMIGR